MMALDYVTEKAYDVIIANWNMPGMNGLELLGRLKQVRPCIPVVMISGHADEALMAEAFQVGAADFILKPIDRDVFLESVRRALNISRLRSLLDHQQALLSRTKDHSLG